MNEWGVFLVVVALLGFIGTVYKMFYQPIHELIIEMTKMNANFENMRQGDNIRDTRINRHSEKIDDHEKRINKLEFSKVYTNESGL